MRAIPYVVVFIALTASCRAEAGNSVGIHLHKATTHDQTSGAQGRMLRAQTHTPVQSVLHSVEDGHPWACGTTTGVPNTQPLSAEVASGTTITLECDEGYDCHRDERDSCPQATCTEGVWALNKGHCKLLKLQPAGSFVISEGPPVRNPTPPTYTCREACAKKYGGLGTSYQCSTRFGTVTLSGSDVTWAPDNKAWASNMGLGVVLVAEDYKSHDLYGNGLTRNCSASGDDCPVSAYVKTDCSAPGGVCNDYYEKVNYCFKWTINYGVL